MGLAAMTEKAELKPRAIKLLAIDLDGTLLNSRHQVSPRNKAALRRASDCGMEVVIATGKTRNSAVDLIAELGIRSPGVFMQGLITAEADGSVRRRITMPETVAAQVVDIGEAQEFDIIAYRDNQAYARQLHQAAIGLTAYGEPLPDIVADWHALLDATDLNKIVLFGEEHQIPHLRAALEAALHDKIHITRASIVGMLEALPANASKGKAVAALMRDMGIAPEAAMAFGDGENDIEMLQAVGIGVAMGNAADALKAVADIIAPANDEDGVARIIEAVALSEKAAVR